MIINLHWSYKILKDKAALFVIFVFRELSFRQMDIVVCVLSTLKVLHLLFLFLSFFQKNIVFHWRSWHSVHLWRDIFFLCFFCRCIFVARFLRCIFIVSFSSWLVLCGLFVVACSLWAFSRDLFVIAVKAANRKKMLIWFVWMLNKITRKNRQVD